MHINHTKRPYYVYTFKLKTHLTCVCVCVCVYARKDFNVNSSTGANFTKGLKSGFGLKFKTLVLNSVTHYYYYYYYVFILSAICPYTTGLKALFNQSDCTGTAPTHKKLTFP